MFYFLFSYDLKNTFYLEILFAYTSFYYSGKCRNKTSRKTINNKQNKQDSREHSQLLFFDNVSIPMEN